MSIVELIEKVNVDLKLRTKSGISQTGLCYMRIEFENLDLTLCFGNKTRDCLVNINVDS